MNLPVVSVTPGPEWAQELNDALDLIDDHDHTAGKGRPITSAALNINDDVSVNNNNFTNARSYNMEDQSSPLSGPTDVRSLYAVMGELYYNDSVGNQIQLTLDGAINATSIGGIGGDYATSTASVTYNSTSKTFFFYQNTNQNAKLDVGDLIIHETVASSNGITLKSPSSLASAYTITLPSALPASTLALQMTNTGQLVPDFIHTAQIDPAGLGAAAYAPGSIGTTALADNSVTAAKIDTAAGLVKITIQSFTAPGDHFVVIPSSVSHSIVRATGAGGGGASGVGSTGGGGGAGAVVLTTSTSLDPSVSHDFAPTDVNIGTEVITIAAHGWVENQSVEFTSSGTLPGGISAATIYYLKTVTTNTFQISTTIGGSAVNLTSQGTGTHTVQSGYVASVGTHGNGGGTGLSQPGTAGGTTLVHNGAVRIMTALGGAGGATGDGGTAGGIGGNSTNYVQPMNPGSTGGSSSDAPTTPINPMIGDKSGIPGTNSGGFGGGAAGGGSIGKGGNGSNGNTSAVDGTAGGTGAGGGGGAGSSGVGGGGGAGGDGYVEFVYWENVNP